MFNWLFKRKKKLNIHFISIETTCIHCDHTFVAGYDPIEYLPDCTKKKHDFRTKDGESLLKH